jgi:hypothetical protein
MLVTMPTRPDRIAAHKIALAQNAERLASLRRVHANLARALADPTEPEARALIERARQQIDLWESNQACSLVYVNAWRRVLRDPARSILLLAQGHKGMEDAMLQNTPFGFAIRDPRFCES